MSTDWATVYQETYADLVRFLYRKVWDPDRAQDLAQETFVRALNEDPENPRSWLFTVAANLARDEARGAIRQRRHLVLLKNEAEAASASVPDPSDAAEAAERAETVRQALDSLNERDREVLLLWERGRCKTVVPVYSVRFGNIELAQIPGQHEPACFWVLLQESVVSEGF